MTFVSRIEIDVASPPSRTAFRRPLPSVDWVREFSEGEFERLAARWRLLSIVTGAGAAWALIGGVVYAGVRIAGAI